MWIGVHEAMFELDPKVTLKMFKNWIFTPEHEEKCSLVEYILEHVEFKPDYYDKLEKTVESEFISDTTLIMPKVIIIINIFFFFIYILFKCICIYLIFLPSISCLVV